VGSWFLLVAPPAVATVAAALLAITPPAAPPLDPATVAAPSPSLPRRGRFAARCSMATGCHTPTHWYT
jgi:hypothetical protein